LQSKTESPACADATRLTERTSSRSRGMVVLHLVFLVALSAFLLLLRLDGMSVSGVTEARVAGPADEMLRQGEWIVPLFNGQPRLEKPPLTYWAVMLTGMVSGQGVNDWTARFPSALCGIVLVVLVYFLGRSMMGARGGFLSALSMLLMTKFITESRLAELDIFLTLFTTLALFFFWIGLQQDPAQPASLKRKRLCYLFMYPAMALGILAKGPVALVIVIVPSLLALIVLRRLGELKHARIVVGTLILCAIALPWFAAVALREPEAARIWFQETLGRYNYVIEKGSSWYYYLPQLPLFLSPWVFLFPFAVGLALTRKSPGGKGLLFALLWFVSLLVFFSTPSEKRLDYLTPLLPACGLLLGGLWTWLFDNFGRGRSRLANLALYGHGVTLFLLGHVMAYYSVFEAKGSAEVGMILGDAVLIGGVATVVLLLARGVRPAFWANVVMCVFMYVLLWGVYLPAVDNVSSSRQFAAEVKKYVSSEDGLAFFGNNDLTIVYYLRRPVELIMTSQQREDYETRTPRGCIIVPTTWWDSKQSLKKYGYEELYRQEDFRNKNIYGFQKRFKGKTLVLIRKVATEPAE